MKGFGKKNESDRNPSSNDVNKVSNIKKNRLLKEALTFHSQANIDQAIKTYESFLKNGYTDPKVFSNYGVICQQKGDIKKAISLYKQSIKLYPEDYSSFLNLGTIIKSNLLENLLKVKRPEKEDLNLKEATMKVIL